MQFTRRVFSQLCAAILVLPLTSALFADEWSFGVIPDTQWAVKMDAPFYGTAIHIIDAINAEFIRQKVDFVIQVGDLVETSSAIAFQTRAAHNKFLDEAGIKFYPVRGNHDAMNYDPGNSDDKAMKRDATAQFKAVFPDLPGADGSFPDLPGAKGMTYSFTHKGGKFILLDTFPLVDDGSKSGKAYTVGDYIPWIESELKKDDHRFSFVFAHKNIQGQNHEDNIFGNKADSNPEMQNAFISCLQKHGVRYYMSGHDHMYHHSLVKSPDGKSEIGQIICGSAAHKFYLPDMSFPKRETPIKQELNRIGFIIVRVEGERTRFEYYSTEPFGAEPKTPTWELRDSFE